MLKYENMFIRRNKYCIRHLSRSFLCGQWLIAEAALNKQVISIHQYSDIYDNFALMAE